MIVIGLTGGIASGKSTVSRRLIEKGVTVIDADLIARQVVEPGKPAWDKIKATFGSTVITLDGNLDREKLGELIFNNEEKRRLLNSITHPHIHREIIKQMVIALVQGKRLMVLDLPLLFETGRFTKYFHKIIVVNADEQKQIDRLHSRNNLTETEARARISSQMPLVEKCSKADYIIDNNGSLEDTLEQVDGVLFEINKSKAYLKYRFLLIFALINLILFIFVFIHRTKTFLKSL